MTFYFQKVFERGLNAIPLSVDLWIHYLTHVKQANHENRAYIRTQFERALEACGLEFRSDKVREITEFLFFLQNTNVLCTLFSSGKDTYVGKWKRKTC